jgi:hypothetical protein
MGVGRRTTPIAFQRACEEFVFTDDMRAAPSAAPSSQKRRPATASAVATPQRAEPPRKPRSNQPDAQILELLAQGIRSATDEDSGWAGIGRVGQIVRQYEPGFSNKDYGHASLSGLLESQPGLFRLRKGDNGQAQVQLIEKPVERQADPLPDDTAEAPARPRRSRQPRKQAAVEAAVAPVQAPVALPDAADSPDAKPVKPRAPRRSRARKPAAAATPQGGE